MTLGDMSLLLKFKDFSSATMTISFAIQVLLIQPKLKSSALLHSLLRSSNYKMALCEVLPF